MNTCDLYIKNLEIRLKDLSNADDLVKLGIFRSRQAALEYRKRGIGPSFFRLGKRILYPKAAIIEWFKEGSNEIGNQTIDNKIDRQNTNFPRQARMACHRGP